MNPNSPRYTQVKFGDDAREAIYEGAREVAEATAITLGPRGRNVLIDKGYETIILHDGVSVADSINPEDPFERNGAKVIQEAAKKQRDEVGDGTTAAMILTKGIVDESIKIITSGVNPMSLRQGFESGADKVIKKIESYSKKVRTLDQKIQIATISAEDAELGKLIAETIHRVGDDGIVTVDESKAAETYVDHQDGMQIDKGYAHQFMITDAERQIAVLEDAYILVTDIPLNNIGSIAKYLEQIIYPNTKKVLFISPEIGLEFLQPLLNVKIAGQFLGIAMRAPGIGTMQTEMLQDICALTGATFISKDAGHKFEDFDFSALGHANRIIQSKIATIIEGGSGHKADVLQRIQVIKKQMEDETISDYDREQLKGRLGRLTNGIAVIKVGGQTEVEMKERKERVIDAVQATQSACKFGLVPGGEVVYLKALDVLNELNLGEKILKEALREPFKILVSNAGYDSGKLLAQWENLEGMLGFDVVEGKWKDMVKHGIIDPTSVPTNAIKTAVSVAVQLSSLGAAVVLQNEEKK